MKPIQSDERGIDSEVTVRSAVSRRRMLALSAIGASVLAGCAGDGPDDDETPDADNDTPAADDDTPTPETNDDDETPEPDDDDDEEDDDDADEEPEEVDAVIGSLVDGDQMHLVVEGVERTDSLGEFDEADEGMEFVVVHLAMKNVSGDFLTVSNFLQTRVRDDEDYSYDQTFVGGGNTFNDGQFVPGEVERGTVVFEVPDDATGLSLQFDFDVAIFGGIDRAYIDLEDETDVHVLEQELGIDVLSVGDTAEHGGISITVNDVEMTDDLGGWSEPDEGKEFFIVDIAVENESGEEQRISTFLQMLVKDGEGFSYQEDWMATGDLERAFDEGSALADGETRRGEVVYQMESGLSPLYWVFEFDLWVDGDKTFWELQ